MRELPALSGQATDPRIRVPHTGPRRAGVVRHPTGQVMVGQVMGGVGGGQVAPQPGAVAPPEYGRLPARPIHPASFAGRAGPDWWWLGCHGGSGASTLTFSVPGGADAFGFWPEMDPPGCRVVLVARTHAGGLWAAQAAARQWASGTLLGQVHLLGLVTVADAPGRLPRPLREMRDLLAGGVPRMWHLPWVEALRQGDPPPKIDFPAAFSDLVADLTRLVIEGTGRRV
jgi:hypothetical protein